LRGQSYDPDYYKWVDEDGTAHYFALDDEDDKWKDEDGLDLELDQAYISGSLTYFKIKDKKDNYKLFYSSGSLKGKLRYVYDRNGNYNRLDYDASGRIDQIRDGSGRIIDLTYSGDLLQSIVDPANRTVATYAYDASERLTTITYADSEQTTFTYAGGGMNKAINYDGYYVYYVYSSTKPYRVIRVDEKYDTTIGGRIYMEYGGNSTLFTDYDGREVLYQFNDFGHTVCVTNEQSLGSGTEFNTSGANNNKVSTVGKTRRSTINYFKDSSFDIGSYWTIASVSGSTGSSAISTTKSYQGAKSAKLYKTNNDGKEWTYQNKTVSTGSYYTLSGYFLADYTDGYDQGAHLFIKYENTDGTWSYKYSSYVPESTSWQRFSMTLYLGSGQTGNLYAGAQLEGMGTVYVDNMQLEAGACANPYNIVQNADFAEGSTTPTFWTLSGETETGDGITTATTPYMLDSKVVELNGKSDKYKSVYQDLLMSGSTGDIYTVGGWMKGDANEPVYIQVTFITESGTTSSKRVEFNEDITEWQYASGQIIAPVDYVRIRVYFSSRYSTNTMIYDGMHVYKETFGQSYTYDEEGNVISATDMANKEDDYAYSANNDLINYTTPKGNETRYYYDDSHNIEHAITPNAIDYFYDYDPDNGNLVTYELHSRADRGAEGYNIKTTVTYGNNDNSVATVKDARGKTTYYDYDATTNLLREVISPNEGLSGAAIRYDYTTSTDLLTRVFLDLDGDNTYDSNETNNLYAYDDDRLSKITTNGLSYFFDYNDFGNNTAVKVGNDTTQTTLVTNTYDTHKGLLTATDFGNGDEVSFTYDSLNRPLKKLYDGAIKFGYYYNGEGNLGLLVDDEINVDYRYTYDAAGRLGMIDRSNGIRSWYQYDDNLASHLTDEYLYEYIGGTNSTFRSAYRADEDGRPVYAVLKKGDENSYRYEITARDQANRTHEISYKLGASTTIFKYNFEFVPGGNGSDTNLIEEVRYNSSADKVNYTYDNNGNILTITSGSNVIEYYYDALNQLTRENNPFLGTNGKTVIYAYNRGGNIENKKEYAFTAGLATPTTLLDAIDYSYDSIWKDKLASYDGNAITYDSIGNPLTYNGWNYAWKWGKRLDSAENTSESISKR